ncbi:MAG TPA: YeeE/YedE family protein, partial [Pseudomonadales bacterium]|nr:YeeE/YedE family protein [Pseudomonadales bacterium]
MSSLEVLKLVAGGASIGLAAAILLLVNGRIAGISGIYAQFIKGDLGAYRWRLAFLLGLLLPGLYLVFEKQLPQFSVGTVSLAVAGLLVGI